MNRTDRLLRLKRFHLEEVKRRIGTFDAMRADVARELANLDHNITREKQRARDNDIGRVALPSLLLSIEARREKLLDTLKEVGRELVAAQLELSSAVEDFKSLEFASEELAKRLAEMHGPGAQIPPGDATLVKHLHERTLRSAYATTLGSS